MDDAWCSQARRDHPLSPASQGTPRPSLWRDAAAMIATPPVRHPIRATLGRNLRAGLMAMLNVWLVTLPGGLLMFAAWYLGWEMSYYKVYEQRAIGPLASLLGMGLWALGLLYLPLGQARQAASGEWRRFHDFGLVLSLLWRSAPAMLPLFLGYWLLGLAFTGYTVLGVLLGNLPPGQARFLFAVLTLLAALVGVPLWLLLRLWAARLYARALLDGVRAEPAMVQRLATDERARLRELDLLPIPGKAPEDLPDSTLTLLNGLRLVCLAGCLGLCLSLPFLGLYVRQFFDYRGGLGWCQHPVVQLPWLPPGAPTPQPLTDAELPPSKH